MAGDASDRGTGEGGASLLKLAGSRWWSASLLPALVGTTLPFWLRPRGFSFSWLGAIEFLVAVLLAHAGFSLLLARFGGEAPRDLKPQRLQVTALVLLIVGALLGLHLSMAAGMAFLVFGVVSLFAGVLYVVPPFSFHRRVGGEFVLSIGLGMLPVLGAYLVQVGDLTRTVYIASLPLVFATALWAVTREMVRRVDDEKEGRESMVTSFGPAFSGRAVVPILAVLVYATLFAAVFTASMIPLALVAVLTFGLVRTVVAVSWSEHSISKSMEEALDNARKLHTALGIIIAASALAALAG